MERLAEDLREMGAGPEAVRKALAIEADDTAFTVHPENAAAVRLFMAVQSQWRTAALSSLGGARLVRTGLDYEGVEAAARMAGLSLTPPDFARLQAMEAEAIAAWAEGAR